MHACVVGGCLRDDATVRTLGTESEPPPDSWAIGAFQQLRNKVWQ